MKNLITNKQQQQNDKLKTDLIRQVIIFKNTIHTIRKTRWKKGLLISILFVFCTLSKRLQ